MITIINKIYKLTSIGFVPMLICQCHCDNIIKIREDLFDNTLSCRKCTKESAKERILKTYKCIIV